MKIAPQPTKDTKARARRWFFREFPHLRIVRHDGNHTFWCRLWDGRLPVGDGIKRGSFLFLPVRATGYPEVTPVISWSPAPLVIPPAPNPDVMELFALDSDGGTDANGMAPVAGSANIVIAAQAEEDRPYAGPEA